MMYRPLIAATLALLMCPAAARAGKDTLTGAALDSYVESIVEAYGGSKAVDKLASYRIEGKVEAHMMGGSGTFRRDFTAPTSLRVDLTYPDRAEVRILAGDKAWRGSANELTAVDGVRRTAMVYQMIRATAPWFIREYRDRLVHERDDAAGHRVYRTLRLKWSDELTVDFWIDDETHRVELVTGTLSVKGQAMSFATRYEQYEQVDGVLVPHKESSFVNQQNTGTTTIDRVDLGAKKLGPFRPGKKAAKKTSRSKTKRSPH